MSVANLSQAARDFIRQNQGQFSPCDLSPAGVQHLREENHKYGFGGFKDCVERNFPVDLVDEEIDGVSCQWVSARGAPARSDNDNGGAETVILYMFGGAFLVGGPDDDISITAPLAHMCGVRLCVPRYSRSPEHTYPTARNEIAAVFSALVKRRKQRVCVVGESAGGHLSLTLVLESLQRQEQQEQQMSPQHIAAVVLMSPWIDLTHSGDCHIALDGIDPTLSVTHFLAPAAKAYAGSRDVASPEISPLFRDIPPKSYSIPTMITSGTRDQLLSDAVRLAQKLKFAHPACVVELKLSELWHVHEWYPQLPEAMESLTSISSFLRRYIH